MKKFLAFSIGLLFVPSLGFAGVERTCADGTFGYDSASLHETADGVELSITGQNLSLPPLMDASLHTITFGNFGPLWPKIHVLLKAEPSSVGENSTWTQSVVPAIPWVPVRIWLEHSVPSLGSWEKLITPIEVDKVSVSNQKDSINLKFIQSFDPKKTTTNLSIHCSGSGMGGPIEIPSRLREWLSQAHASQE